jgi:hypothetical protein
VQITNLGEQCQLEKSCCARPVFRPRFSYYPCLCVLIFLLISATSPTLCARIAKFLNSQRDRRRLFASVLITPNIPMLTFCLALSSSTEPTHTYSVRFLTEYVYTQRAKSGVCLYCNALCLFCFGPKSSCGEKRRDTPAEAKRVIVFSRRGTKRKAK